MKSSRGRWWCRGLVLASLMLAAVPTAVVAQPQEDARALEARRECSAGHVQRGVELLAALFVETSEPLLVYNQGRCYEENGRLEEAVERFREYVRTLHGAPGAASEIQETEARIKQLDERIAQRRRLSAPPPAMIVAQQPAPPPERPLHKRPWFWVALGAVAAGTATAIVLATRHPADASFSCPDCSLGLTGVRTK